MRRMNKPKDGSATVSTSVTCLSIHFISRRLRLASFKTGTARMAILATACIWLKSFFEGGGSLAVGTPFKLLLAVADSVSGSKKCIHIRAQYPFDKVLERTQWLEVSGGNDSVDAFGGDPSARLGLVPLLEHRSYVECTLDDSGDVLEGSRRR